MVSVGPADFESISWGIASSVLKPIVQTIIETREYYKVGDLNAKLTAPTAVYAITNGLSSLDG